MKKNSILWAALPIMAVAFMTTACSSDDSATQTPLQQSTAKSIPYTVTVNSAATTRATVESDNKTLYFATGDKLYITGTNVKGVLDIQEGTGTASATFSGDLAYSGEGSPAADLELTATLVSAQQSDGAEIAVNATTGAVTVNYPSTAYCADVAAAVQKYSNLTGTSTYGSKSFSLSQQTAFLNFVITFEDGTATGTALSAVVSNNSAAICTADVTTVTESEKVVAKFVLPIAGSTTLSGATVKMGDKDAIAFGASQTLAGKVYNVAKTQAETIIAVTSVELDADEMTLTVGDEGQLQATVAPEDATDADVDWSSSDVSVATVDGAGNVTAVAEGTATITAKAGDKAATCTVTVKAATIAVTSVELDADEMTLKVGDEGQLQATVAPENAANKSVTWSSSNESVATVEQNGKISAVGVGEATITVTTTDGGKTATCKVIVNKKAGAISYATASVNKTFGDANFTNELTKTGDGTVTYSSSDTKVAEVDSKTGEVTIKGNGEATITATVADGPTYTYATKTASYTIGVGTAAMTVSATGYSGTYDNSAHGITVNAPEGATIKYGTAAGTYTLEASPTYTTSGEYTVYYQVAKPGYTTVTGSATVTISKAAGSISYATASIEKLTTDAAFTNALTKTGDGKVTYSSDKESVAKVNTTTGEVTIMGKGEATITATVTDGDNYTYATKTASYKINVSSQGGLEDYDKKDGTEW